MSPSGWEGSQEVVEGLDGHLVVPGRLLHALEEVAIPGSGAAEQLGEEHMLVGFVGQALLPFVLLASVLGGGL